jgi:hypothetical protein
VNLHQLVINTFDLSKYPTKETLVSAVQLNALQLINSGQKVSIEEIPAAVEQVWVEKAANPVQPVIDAQPEQIDQPTAVAAAEPVQPEPVQTEDEGGWEFEEVLNAAYDLKEQGLTDTEMVTVLNEKYADIDQDELDEIIKKANSQVSGEIKDLREITRNAVDESDRHLVEKHQIAGTLGKDIDPDDKKRAAAVIRAREQDEAEKEAREETFDDAAEEPFPECPIFPGALTDLARALYPSLPLEFKQWGLIVRWGLMRSGLDHLESEGHLQSRFYTVLVSPPNRGKTACINESRTAMSSISKMVVEEQGQAHSIRPTSRMCADVENLASADSGPFLVQEFYNVAKQASEKYMNSICSDNAAKVLLDPDELSDVFEKARTSNNRVSTLFIELLKLHSGNRTANGTKQTGNRSVNNAHLSILAGTTVKKYPMLWTGTGGGADGLVSRFLAITTNAKQVPPVPLPSDFEAAAKTYSRLAVLAQVPGQTVRLSEEARTILTDWWTSIDSGKQSTTRILEAVKQLLVVLAVTNLPADWAGSTVTVGPELVRHAIAFGNYEIAVRERLNPGDSWSNIQAMENAIIAWFKKHASRKLPMARNDCRRGIRPDRLPGGIGAFLLAWANCVNAGYLKVRERTQRDSKYSL